ncbi:MAG TPA: hypothetical protein VM282_18065 [Acidimicrobiales bacterium]|nr:hypothetical protein [Acidimicrobiales bacterium]
METPEETRTGGREYEAAVAAGTHVLERRPAHVERAGQVRCEQRIDVVVGEVLEGRVPEDARVVDHCVEPAECIEARLHDALAAL